MPYRNMVSLRLDDRDLDALEAASEAVHALNTIALLVRRGSPPKPPELEAMLGRALSALEEVEAGRRVLEAALTEVADSIAVRRD